VLLVVLLLLGCANHHDWQSRMQVTLLVALQARVWCRRPHIYQRVQSGL